MRTPLRLLSFLALASGAGCAADVVREPFLLDVASSDVQTSAFDSVEIVIEPRMPSESFGAMSEGVYFNGAVRTRVAGRSLTITVNGAYFRGSNMPGEGETVRVRFPLYAETDLDSPTGSDPTVTVYFLKGASRIAEGHSVLPWPLPDGSTSPKVTVACGEGQTIACAGP